MGVMASLTQSAEQYAQIIAADTGLNLGVVQAWVGLESAWGQSPAGAYNYLNLRGPGGPFASYGSVQQAAQAVVSQLKGAPEWYGNILKAASASPAQQIAAIAASPWDAGHYGGSGGPNLLRTYDGMTGQKLQVVADPAQPAQTGGGQTSGTAQPGGQASTGDQTVSAPPPTADENIRAAAASLAGWLVPQDAQTQDQLVNHLVALGTALKGSYQNAPQATPSDQATPERGSFSTTNQVAAEKTGVTPDSSSGPPEHLQHIITTNPQEQTTTPAESGGGGGSTRME